MKLVLFQVQFQLSCITCKHEKHLDSKDIEFVFFDKFTTFNFFQVNKHKDSGNEESIINVSKGKYHHWK